MVQLDTSELQDIDRLGVLEQSRSLLCRTGSCTRYTCQRRGFDQRGVCALALTHAPGLAPVLAKFSRVLRPGGHLVTSDIHVLSLYLGGVPPARQWCAAAADAAYEAVPALMICVFQRAP
ncbi:MAG TPA: hypothetical protein VGI58_10650 [Streptosporangiaceae bacterium]